MKFKNSRLVSLSNYEFNFFIVLWSDIKKIAFSVRKVLKKFLAIKTSAENMKSKSSDTGNTS